VRGCGRTRGFALAKLSASTVDALAQILPGFATAGNPLDLIASLLGNGAMFAQVLDVLGSDAQADMVAIGVPVAGPGRTGLDIDRAACGEALQFSCASAQGNVRTAAPLITAAIASRYRTVATTPGSNTTSFP
jgi:acyl-CoA synthetase (NDP forming)